MDEPKTITKKVVYIPGNMIDRKKWDYCIENAPNGNICAYSWFLDIMCKGWSGMVQGDYEYVMPIPLSKRFGVNYLFQPRFIQQLGVFGLDMTDVMITNSFIEALPKEIKIVDYHLNHKNLPPLGWEIELRTNLLLNLFRSYDEIRKAYSLNLTRNLKKASLQGFIIKRNHDTKSLIRLFRENKGRELPFITDENYRQLNRVFSACADECNTEVWSVFNQDNELSASAIWLFSHGKAVFFFSAQREAGRAEGAMPWLIDAFIRNWATYPFELDFEGSVDPGLSRFYRSFGSYHQLYMRIKRNNLSPLANLAYHYYKKMKKG